MLDILEAHDHVKVICALYYAPNYSLSRTMMSEAVKSSSAPGSESQAFGSPAARRLNPKKLLLSKWTAATPHDKEKHFIVTGVIQPESPATRIESIELESVYSRRLFSLPWRDLTDGQQWLQGWQ